MVAFAAAIAVLPACRSQQSLAGPTTTTSPPTTSTTTTSTTSTTSTTTTTLPPTTTTLPIITEGGIVKVANASGVDGAAGRLTDELAALGFETRRATNAAGPDSDLQVSKIYVKPGAEAVAESISRLMGGLEIFPMPTPAWIQGATESLADANVLIMLGHDLAGTALDDIT
ncbi:MAG TPA: hypothetical protein DCR14_04500 [Acidimicrobiaceae bacterium]|nr:hypothetical protein [Acidimicrobiaceae bacterium]